MDVPSVAVLKSLQVVIAAIGADMKPETVAVIAGELSEYPEPWVLAALARCKVECRFRLCLADVIERMDDGHPAPDEAWELVPKSEADTAVLTDEIMQAIPWDLMASGDLIAARMAFREAYGKIRAQARAAKRAPIWRASLGHDKEARAGALLDAVRLNRLTSDQLKLMLPAPSALPRAPLLLPDIPAEQHGGLLEAVVDKSQEPCPPPPGLIEKMHETIKRMSPARG